MSAPYICHYCLRPVERTGLKVLKVHPSCQQDSARRKRLAARCKSNPNPPTKADLDEATIARRIDAHLASCGWLGARRRITEAA